MFVVELDLLLVAPVPIKSVATDPLRYIAKFAGFVSLVDIWQFMFTKILLLLLVGVMVAVSPDATNDPTFVVDSTVLYVELTTCNTFPNPVADPEFVSVAPDGIVMVSPLSPIWSAVPVAGLTLFVFSSLLMV